MEFLEQDSPEEDEPLDETASRHANRNNHAQIVNAEVTLGQHVDRVASCAIHNVPSFAKRVDIFPTTARMATQSR